MTTPDSEHTPAELVPPRANAATLLRYMHEERMAQLSKRADNPVTFSAKRATTSGAIGEWELTVSVAVCDEYPTAELAFEAQVGFMRALAEAFPNSPGKVKP